MGTFPLEFLGFPGNYEGQDIYEAEAYIGISSSSVVKIRKKPNGPEYPFRILLSDCRTNHEFIANIKMIEKACAALREKAEDFFMREAKRAEQAFRS
jgi:hypothetical protein